MSKTKSKKLNVGLGESAVPKKETFTMMSDDANYYQNAKGGLIDVHKFDEDCYLPDVITKNVRDAWPRGSSVLIQSQTGTGKSSLIFDIIEQANEEQANEAILLLFPRAILAREMAAEYGKEFLNYPVDLKDGVYEDRRVMIMLWQKFVSKCWNDRSFKQRQFSQIIVDEAHDLCTAATYSKETEAAWDALLGMKTTWTMWLTATDDTFRDLWAESIEATKSFFYTGVYGYYYSFPSDYSYINLDYVNNDDEVAALAKALKPEKKMMVYVDNKEHGSTLKEQIEIALYGKKKKNKEESEVMLLHADNKNYIKEKAYIDEMIRTNSFPGKVLIATSVCELGINLKDKNIEVMVISSTRRDGSIQAIGRRRVRNKDGSRDSLDVYIYLPLEKTVTQRITNASLALAAVKKPEKEISRGLNAGQKMPPLHYHLDKPHNGRCYGINHLGIRQFETELAWLEELKEGFYTPEGVGAVYRRWLGLGQANSIRNDAIKAAETEDSEIIEIDVSDNIAYRDPDREAFQKALLDLLEPYVGEKLSKDDKGKLRSAARTLAEQHKIFLKRIGITINDRPERMGTMLQVKKLNKMLEAVGIPLKLDKDKVVKL